MTAPELMTIYAFDGGYRAVINISDCDPQLIYAPNVRGQASLTGPFLEGQGATLSEAVQAVTVQLGVAALHALRKQRAERDPSPRS